MEKISFEELLEPNFLDKLYTKFKEHIKDYKKGFFNDVIQEEIFVGNDKDNIHKVFGNMGINMTDKEICDFLESNCYNVCIPQMKLAGHDFNESEKLCIAGFGFFVDSIFDEEYPFSRPEEQVQEFRDNAISKDFINTTAQWNIDSLVKQYQEYITENYN